MEIQPTDIAILLVSAAACIYCIVLNRRLKALQNTKDGLGASILAFSKSMSDMSQTTHNTRSHAGQIAGHLTDLLNQANEASSQLQKLTQDFDTEHSALIRQATLEGNQVCERIEKLTRDLDARAADSFDGLVLSAQKEYEQLKAKFEALQVEHADRYDDALAQAETSCDWIESKTEEGEKRLTATLDAIKTSQEAFDAEMHNVFAECAKQVAEMTTLASQVRSLSDRSKFNIEEALLRSEKSILLNTRVES